MRPGPIAKFDERSDLDGYETIFDPISFCQRVQYIDRSSNRDKALNTIAICASTADYQKTVVCKKYIERVAQRKSLD